MKGRVIAHHKKSVIDFGNDPKKNPIIDFLVIKPKIKTVNAFKRFHVDKYGSVKGAKKAAENYALDDMA